MGAGSFMVLLEVQVPHLSFWVFGGTYLGFSQFKTQLNKYVTIPHYKFIKCSNEQLIELISGFIPIRNICSGSEKISYQERGQSYLCGQHSYPSIQILQASDYWVVLKKIIQCNIFWNCLFKVFHKHVNCKNLIDKLFINASYALSSCISRVLKYIFCFVLCGFLDVPKHILIF